MDPATTISEYNYNDDIAGPTIPDYDEDFQEAFIGPAYMADMAEMDETYDDDYEAQSTAAIEAREPGASVIVPSGIVSDYTHPWGSTHAEEDDLEEARAW